MERIRGNLMEKLVSFDVKGVFPTIPGIVLPGRRIIEGGEGTRFIWVKERGSPTYKIGLHTYERNLRITPFSTQRNFHEKKIKEKIEKEGIIHPFWVKSTYREDEKLQGKTSRTSDETKGDNWKSGNLACSRKTHETDADFHLLKGNV